MKVDEKSLQKFLKTMDKYPKDKQDLVVKSIEAAAFDTMAEAKRNAPVDTGRLRSDVQLIERRKDGLGITVGNTVHYAPHQEYGTKHMKAQPYLLPAWRKATARLIKDINTVFKKR